jgi:hypothetical protein
MLFATDKVERTSRATIVTGEHPILSTQSADSGHMPVALVTEAYWMIWGRLRLYQVCPDELMFPYNIRT